MLTRTRLARQAQRLRVIDVAALAGCSTTTVVRMDNGRAVERMTVGTLLRLAQALKTPAVELLPALGLQCPLGKQAGVPGVPVQRDPKLKPERMSTR